jgi:hypothetical protein
MPSESSRSGKRGGSGSSTPSALASSSAHAQRAECQAEGDEQEFLGGTVGIAGDAREPGEPQDREREQERGVRRRRKPRERRGAEARDRDHGHGQLPRTAARGVGERGHRGEQEAGDETLLESLDHEPGVERAGIRNHAERVERPHRAAGQRECQSDGKEDAIGLDRARRGTRRGSGVGVHGVIQAGLARARITTRTDTNRGLAPRHGDEYHWGTWL